MNITERLFELRDEKYRAFNSRLVPNVDAERIVGVRLPELRRIAREIKSSEAASVFLSSLPHCYQEENLLHALLLNEERDIAVLLTQLESFLPRVDNWAVCDTLKPKAFLKRRPELLELLPKYLGSGHAYTVRFGLEMLMTHFLDKDFSPAVLDIAFNTAEAKCGEEYYIDMMSAWFFATALAKQYDAALQYAERLPEPVRRMTVRKACESFRLTDGQKAEVKARCQTK